jgi:methionine synthase II (cobalamin-independent)
LLPASTGAIKVLAYQPGLYPRSERVVAATRGLERGRVRLEEVEAAYQQDLRDFVAVQQEAKVDFFSDGLLRWQDHFRPLAEAAGLPTRALTRWFDNNAFFRAPQLNGAPQPITRIDSIVPDSAVPTPRVATLPSPYTFSRAVVTGGDKNVLMLELVRNLLRPAIEVLVASGCRLVHLQEPWLGFFGIDRADRAPLERALDTLTSGLDASVVFHIYFGDAAAHVDWLRRLPVHAVGVDLVETDVNALGAKWETGLLTGCIDGRSSVLESATETTDLIRRVADQTQPPVLYVSSSCDLELLPRDIAAQKVLVLGAAARHFYELVE